MARCAGVSATGLSPISSSPCGVICALGKRGVRLSSELESDRTTMPSLSEIVMFSLRSLASARSSAWSTTLVTSEVVDDALAGDEAGDAGALPEPHAASTIAAEAMHSMESLRMIMARSKWKRWDLRDGWVLLALHRSTIWQRRCCRPGSWCG